MSPRSFRYAASLLTLSLSVACSAAAPDEEADEAHGAVVSTNLPDAGIYDQVSGPGTVYTSRDGSNMVVRFSDAPSCWGKLEPLPSDPQKIGFVREWSKGRCSVDVERDQEILTVHRDLTNGTERKRTSNLYMRRTEGNLAGDWFDDVSKWKLVLAKSTDRVLTGAYVDPTGRRYAFEAIDDAVGNATSEMPPGTFFGAYAGECTAGIRVDRNVAGQFVLKSFPVQGKGKSCPIANNFETIFMR